MKKKLIVFLILPVLAAACTDSPETEKSEKTEAPLTNTEHHRRMVAHIDSLEAVFNADTLALNSEAAIALLKEYNRFVDIYPADKEKSPEYLYKAAALSRQGGKPLDAIRHYDLILKKYPKHERNPEVAFLIGFTYDADMDNPELAKESYREVIEKFPDDTWAVQAKQRLENIDLSDEELIEKFMKAQENS